MTHLGGALAGCVPWTPQEDALFAAAYSQGGIAAAAAALPDRSEHALKHRAGRLGLQRRRRWTAADDQTLRDGWELGWRVSIIAKHLGRTKAATYKRAQDIGLPLGVPDGWEHLSAAAERTGYATQQLRRILRWAGVHMRNALSRPCRSRSGRRQWIVEPEVVDEAVAKWHGTEPVTAAARRVGVGDELLRGRLLRLGLKRPGGKRHLRVTPAQVAAALALGRRGIPEARVG